MQFEELNSISETGNDMESGNRYDDNFTLVQLIIYGSVTTSSEFMFVVPSV